ncbi:MAG: hypothetical protein JXA82_01835 [Sedimentisphaerales bacterium]|nr:hypothetical protein [Sedimentisphaerales bacterium]
MFKRSLKILSIAVLCTILIVVIGAVLLKFWVGPLFIREQFLQAVEPRWDGTVKVGGVTFHFFRPVELHDVAFLDRQDRIWARSETVSIVLGDWPGWKPSPLEIRMERAEVYFYCDDQPGISIPIVKPDAVGDSLKTLERCVVQKMAFHLIDPDELILNYGQFHLDVNFDPQRITFRALQQGIPDSQESLNATLILDRFNQSYEANVKLYHRFEEEEMALIVPFFAEGRAYRCRGILSADLVLTGKMETSEDFQANGDVFFSEWDVLQPSGEMLIDDFAGNFHIAGKHLYCPGLALSFCGADIHASLETDIEDMRPVSLQGQVVVRGLDLEKLSQHIVLRSGLDRGRVDIDYVFVEIGPNPEDLYGYGFVTAEDANLSASPFMRRLFELIGLSDMNPLAMSDGLAIFSTRGGRITFQQGQVSNRLAAVLIEPGGWIDVSAKTVDLYAIGVPIKTVQNLLQKIPLVNILVGFKDKIVRVRVEGNYAESPEKMIRKELLRDVKQGLVQIFVDLAQSGGELTDLMQQGARTFFDTIRQTNSSKTSEEGKNLGQ